MRPNSSHQVEDPEVVRRLIRENPWATIVSHHGGELVASHYPLLLDEESEELAVFSHVGRPDEELHGLGEHELLTEHFERQVAEPMYVDLEWGAPVARGTVGIRVKITRFDCKLKLSQDKDPDTQTRVMRALRAPGPYRNDALAADMQRATGS